jgi:hypothetical protein
MDALAAPATWSGPVTGGRGVVVELQADGERGGQRVQAERQVLVLPLDTAPCPGQDLKLGFVHMEQFGIAHDSPPRMPSR